MMLSWDVCEILRGLPFRSCSRIWEELGVGSGDPDGVLLGPDVRLLVCVRSEVAAMGGKAGENTDGGRRSRV